MTWIDKWKAWKPKFLYTQGQTMIKILIKKKLIAHVGESFETEIKTATAHKSHFLIELS